MRGSSPLQAALRRLVAGELTQHTENQEACTVFFDVESFYDSISLSLVARAGLKLAYLPSSIGFGSAHIRRGSVPNRGMEWFQRRNCHQ